MVKSRWIIAVGLMLCIVSCTKGDGTEGNGNGGNGSHVYNPSDLAGPAITINMPTSNQVFVSGNTINVSGTVTDDLGLYRGQIRIIDNANGLELKQQAYEIHGLRSYQFSLSYLATANAPKTYTVAVFFEDHGYNAGNKSVQVMVNP